MSQQEKHKGSEKPQYLISLEEKWVKDYPAYSLAKFGMSVYALAFSGEFKEHNIASNCLWPRTAIATAAVKNLLGGDESIKRSRTPDIMGDAAIFILNSDSSKVTGKFFIDDEVLVSMGTNDLEKYNCVKGVSPNNLMPDFFI